MLAMHYAIPLTGAIDVATVRARANERGPLFDGMEGLRAKLFLVDPVVPCYATFYLWSNPDAALGFLEGDFFAALCGAFGRPQVKLLLSHASDLPFRASETVSIDTSPSGHMPRGVSAVDPLTGDTLVLNAAASGGRQFQVMYRAVGGN